MDLNWQSFYHRTQQFISNGKLKLSRRFQSNPERRQNFQNASILLFAIILGITAHEFTQNEGIRNWLQSHPPSKQMMKNLLATKNFIPLSETPIQHRILKSLPLQWDEPTSIWISQDHDWIVIFPKQTQEIPLIYAHQTVHQNRHLLKSKYTPKNWIPLGTSWPGAENLLQILEKRPPDIPPQLPQKVKKKSFSDLREIKY